MTLHTLKETETELTNKFNITHTDTFHTDQTETEAEEQDE
jgi:hypothetical protein